MVVADVEELLGGSDPMSVAVSNARLKAEAVLRAGPAAGIVSPSQAPGASDPRATGPIDVPAAAAPPQPLAPSSMPVLGVDTIVVLDGVVYGKPSDEADARAMLARLSGRVHEVVSGICVVEAGEVRTAAATTRVEFRELDGLLDWYVATGEWRERAGGYAIQGRGAALVRGIEGDYLNVVGLPVSTLLELLPGILQAGS